MKDGYKRKYAQMMTDHFRCLLKDGEAVIGIPSLVSFAEEIGVTTAMLKKWKECYEEFANAYDECIEKQQQLIIDGAFCKKIDGSFAKYYLSAVFGLGEKDEREDTISLSDEDKNLLENIKRRLYGE